MGFFLDLFRGRTLAESAAPTTGVRFADLGGADPALIYGTPTLDQAIFGTGRVPRRMALQVPAVKLADELITGVISGMPLHLVGPDGQPVSGGWSLFDQPEDGVPRSVSMARLVRDMLFDERCILRITHLGWHGKPAEVVRLEADSVPIQPVQTTYPQGVAYTWPRDPEIIRLESPKHGLLVAGGRAIRALWRLEASAGNIAGGEPPLDYFSPTDDFDMDEVEVEEFLDEWETARRKRRTGYVPTGLEYNFNGFNAEQLQMMQQREFAITEIARLTGLDAERLSVSTTSRTYFNAESVRKDFLDFVIGPFLTAIQDRLSMNDVTPNGYRAVFDPTGFLTADDASRATTDKTLVDAKIISREEARERRGLPPGAPELDPPAPAPAALPAPAREETPA